MIEMGPKLSFKLGGATVTATGSKASGFRGFLPTPAAQPTHALRARSLGSFHDEDHVDNFFFQKTTLNTSRIIFKNSLPEAGCTQQTSMTNSLIA